MVELSTGIAGAYCTKLLADGGADVIKVEPPEGDPLRSWSASGAVIEPGADGALFSFLNGGKHSVVADPASAADVDIVSALLTSADSVVWSVGSAVAARFRPEEMQRRHRHLVVTSITPFGLEGPWRDCPATEFTLQAWSGGIVGLGRASRIGRRYSSAARSANIWLGHTRALPLWRSVIVRSVVGQAN
ncbi:coA-transferase III family protein [Mycobacterium kansasii]|uniref:CoA-transferase III family protein n=1 Tax=Mycobacterium kansasii TaxID=1768 RepID=A0A1V3WVM3_MYCKA|nr:coA-transferase III family protein [Mycobacterium kansasii]